MSATPLISLLSKHHLNQYLQTLRIMSQCSFHTASLRVQICSLFTDLQQGASLKNLTDYFFPLKTLLREIECLSLLQTKHDDKIRSQLQTLWQLMFRIISFLLRVKCGYRVGLRASKTCRYRSCSYFRLLCLVTLSSVLWGKKHPVSVVWKPNSKVLTQYFGVPWPLPGTNNI